MVETTEKHDSAEDRRSELTDLLCKVFGHKCDQIHAEYYGFFHCDRCGKEFEDDPCLIERIKRKTSIWFDERTRPLRRWFRCSECGWRFGRHNPENDHLPF